MFHCGVWSQAIRLDGYNLRCVSTSLPFSHYVGIRGLVGSWAFWAKQYSSTLKFSFHRARGHLHSWPLPNNWVSLNTDGSVKFDEGFAASGGCVRDHNGEWIGFAKYLGNCIILEVKLWGILDGLNLILDRRIERILIQTDSIEAINLILDDSFGSLNSALVRKIHLILRKMEQWKIQCIPRKENLIADTLAKSVPTRRLGLRLFIDPPLGI
ncbi:hypothetical protein PVK06_038313 [Gossypium arboreum]|uniref:RNase H type-1 domain-containing protein n=1 Tax=Gossypium arboreum TaxID=29729 RepID=A0ABR0MZU1_GOSAR|nr:hypothetical protein PVK06_038313 [Gossypium arboreum]